MKIDHEYSCVWIEEQRFLFEKGIRYTFVKEINGTLTWKYKKDTELFNALAEFYKNVYQK